MSTSQAAAKAAQAKADAKRAQTLAWLRDTGQHAALQRELEADRERAYIEDVRQHQDQYQQLLDRHHAAWSERMSVARLAPNVPPPPAGPDELHEGEARRLAAALFRIGTEAAALDTDPQATIAALARQELLDKALTAVEAVESFDANPSTSTPWRTERGPVAPLVGPMD